MHFNPLHAGFQNGVYEKAATVFKNVYLDNSMSIWIIFYEKS